MIIPTQAKTGLGWATRPSFFLKAGPALCSFSLDGK
jgi:hypothetical protein